MKLTPIEIRKQEFNKSMRGYDTVEVDTFLESMADEYEQLLADHERQSKMVKTLDNELKHFKDVEKTLKQTLYNVQETSQLSKENSQKAANLVKKEAELEAEKILDKTRLAVHKMQEEILSLKQQKESFISRLKHLLSSQLELLDVLEIDDVERGKIKDRSKKVFSAPRKSHVAQPSRVSTPAGKPIQAKKSPVSEENMKPAPENNKTKNGEYFKDIFDDNLDIDEILK